MDIRLSIGMADNPRTRAIFDRRVKPDGIDLVASPVHASELFWRQLRFSDFDVSEMSFSSLMIAMAQGDDRWVGLPIFTTRRFFHASLIVRSDRNIEEPVDLKGKKVGVPEYQQTAALWTRGVLQHEFGVIAQDLEWWMERNPERSHGGATGFIPPEGVKLHYVPQEESLASLLLAGEIDAAVHYLPRQNLIDRSAVDLTGHPNIKPIFPDPHAEGIRYYNKTGIYPINHGMVIKREIAEQEPWAILNLFKAFQAANEIAEAERLAQAGYHVDAGLIDASALKTQLVRHGIAANRTVLETAAQYSHEQGLTPRLMKLDEMFSARTMQH